MSDQNTTNRDRGFSLPEVLISVTITAVLLTALVSAVSVVLRSADNNLGRTNNARSEQSVGLWMPSDLASAETVITTPGPPPAAVPCGGIGQGACPAGWVHEGSNTLLLTWHSSTVVSGFPVTTTTAVSYRYVQVGDEYVLKRVECNWQETPTGPTMAECQAMTVLRELDPPPSGKIFNPGYTSPDWVIKVTSALGADDTTSVVADVEDPGLNTKNARRVLVTINGGGDAEGAGGGRNTFSFSAGGTDRETSLSTEDLGGAPTFIAARTRCGGNFGLIVDRSGSIGSYFPTVRQGVLDFVDTFAGKPVRLQVVAFDALSSTLGATDGWTRYYDMLEPADVADLKAQVSALNSGGGTNYEDAWFRMLRNPDGSLRSVLPDKVIFFTDGIPTRSMLESASVGTTPNPAHPNDGGLPALVSGQFYQRGWNRTDRIIVDSGATDIVGVLVGPDSAGSSNWVNAGAGFVYAYEVGAGVTFQQQSGFTYERGNNVVYERGQNDSWFRNNNVLYERGYHDGWERNNNIVFERAQTGLVWERLVGTTWSGVSWNTYRSNNSTPDSTDGWRTRITGALASWSSISDTQYYATNATTDSTDGYRTRVNGSLSTSWTVVTQPQYNSSNTTADSIDGWRQVKNYASPYSFWESVTESAYESGNTVSASTDGWRTRVNGSLSTGWTPVSSSLFTESNTTADDSDGWRSTGAFLPPYTSWVSTTETAYDLGNTVAGESDGWRTRQTATSTSWTTVSSTTYNLSNTTTDATDGWRTTPLWTDVTKAAYEAGNTAVGEADGWRPVAPGSAATSWLPVSKAVYDLSNTTSDSADHWRRVKTYPVGAPSYDGYEGYSTESRTNERILGDLVAPGGVIKAVYNSSTGSYGDVREVNMFVETNWDRFDDAIRDVALGECGGTVTIQTKTESGTAVADPFTYSNQLFQTVETSSAYKSGTFDVVLPGATAAAIEINLQNLSSLNSWEHVSWSCKTRGVAIGAPDMVVGAADSAGWRGLTLNVAANSAISCVQTVRAR